MNQIRIALIGCGAAAHKYYIPVLKENPKLSRHVYCVDTNLDLAKCTAHAINTEYFTDNYQKILENIDGAIIAVPHFLHHKIAMEIIQKKIPVLCEKPLAETGEQAHELITLAEKQKVTLCVNNTRRLFPSFRSVKEKIESGELGKINKIFYFEANKFAWESQTSFYVNPSVSPKGVLLDLGSHVLDLICWWFGGKPDLLKYFDDSFGGPESLARILAQKNSIQIEIVLNRLLDLNNRFVIQGHKMTIEGSLTDWKSLKIISSPDKIRTLKIHSEFKSYPDMVRKIVLNFIDVIRGIAAPLIPGSEVIDSIKWIEECYAHRNQFNLPWYQNLEDLVDGQKR